jgi:hypothetical protein
MRSLGTTRAGKRPSRRIPGVGEDQLYELLVVQRGWSVSRFARFIFDFMIAA